MSHIGLTAMLRCFARLPNLRRSPGAQGTLKYVIMGPVRVYMQEDWSNYSPWPTSMSSTNILTDYQPLNFNMMLRNLFDYDLEGLHSFSSAWRSIKYDNFYSFNATNDFFVPVSLCKNCQPKTQFFYL